MTLTLEDTEVSLLPKTKEGDEILGGRSFIMKASSVEIDSQPYVSRDPDLYMSFRDSLGQKLHLWVGDKDFLNIMVSMVSEYCQNAELIKSNHERVALSDLLMEVVNASE